MLARDFNSEKKDIFIFIKGGFSLVQITKKTIKIPQKIKNLYRY